MKTFTKKEAAKAYDKKGQPLLNGPRCATCGDLAAWGQHPQCETVRGCLVLAEKE